MIDFQPKRFLSNGHLMTLFAWGKKRHFPRLPAPSERFFDVAPDTRVLAHCHWQPNRDRCPALLALHGLEGSSSAHYMRGLADKAFARGFNVILLNQRNCGGTEALAAGLYHSGLTADADHVIRDRGRRRHRRIIVAGYSLGGNLALKLAGDYGDAPPPSLRAVCAVSPVMELERCVRALERQAELRLPVELRARPEGAHAAQSARLPRPFPIDRLDDVRTVRAVRRVLHCAAFRLSTGPSDYYHRASAMRTIDRIRVPALIISAEDDPFVPRRRSSDPRITANPHIR